MRKAIRLFFSLFLFTTGTLLHCVSQLAYADVAELDGQSGNSAPAARAKVTVPGAMWWGVISTLDRRTVKARVEKSLLIEMHRDRHDGAGSFRRLNRIDFSRRRFPIVLGAREEWPPAIGGCLYLLHGSAYTNALAELKLAATASVKKIPVIQRVIIQNAIWDVFGSLYLQGTAPWYSQITHRGRWNTLLFWLAHDMAHIAVPVRGLALCHKVGVVRRRLLGPKLWRKAVELYSFQQPTIHTLVLNFRRIVRVYIYDPKVDFAKLSVAEVRAYACGRRWLSTGAVAIEVEDAIAVSPRNAGLVSTRIPIIARSYRVFYADRRNLMPSFSIYRLPRSATTLSSKYLRKVHGDFGTWALLNLPTIPNSSEGFLARYPVVCAQCHYPGVIQTLRAGISSPHARYFQLTRSSTGFVRMRTITRQRESSEYEALRFFWSEAKPTPHERPGSAEEVTVRQNPIQPTKSGESP